MPHSTVADRSRAMVRRAFVTAMLTIGVTAPLLAQTAVSRDREEFVRRLDYLIRDGGEWSSPNQDYTPGRREARTFGYQWKWLFDRQVAQLEIFGVSEGGERATFWITSIVWDPTVGQGRMHQVGSNGTFADGRLSWVRDGENEVRLTFVTAEGEVWAFREVDTIIGPHEFRTTSARLRGGVWTDARTSTWTRVVTAKE